MPHAPCLARPLIHLVPIYLCGNMACVHGIMSCALDVRLVVSRCPRVRFGRRAGEDAARGASADRTRRGVRRRRSAVSVRRDWKTELLQRKARRLSTFDISRFFCRTSVPAVWPAALPLRPHSARLSAAAAHLQSLLGSRHSSNVRGFNVSQPHSSHDGAQCRTAQLRGASGRPSRP